MPHPDELLSDQGWVYHENCTFLRKNFGKVREVQVVTNWNSKPDPIAEARIFSMGSRIETTNPENGFPAFNFGGWIVWGLTYRILLSYLNRKVQKS